jgi:hypothetical protein
MSSGAGHDAQMIARIAPAAMIFVPSRGGISHNPREHTDEAQLIQGAQLLLDTVQDCLCGGPPPPAPTPAPPRHPHADPQPRAVRAPYPAELAALMNHAQAQQNRLWLADWPGLNPGATRCASCPTRPTASAWAGSA